MFAITLIKLIIYTFLITFRVLIWKLFNNDMHIETKCHKNVKYSMLSKTKNSLSKKLIICFPGGGWLINDRRTNLFLARQFVRLDYDVISFDILTYPHHDMSDSLYAC